MCDLLLALIHHVPLAHILSCMMCIHVLCASYTGLVCPWHVIFIPMYNAHPYFPLNNVGKKVHIIHHKIQGKGNSNCTSAQRLYCLVLLFDLKIFGGADLL